ncbi:MAG TPA: hypothetical protein VD905_20945, partial [Flavobacteriales bacterium]|nr:hypothetical protein [Flavobacteriales bacterium]
NVNTSKTSKWINYNNALAKVNYAAPSAGSRYENVYFKELGEKSVDGDPIYANTGGGAAVRYDMTPMGYDAILEPEFQDTYGNTTTISSQLKRANRMKRNNCIYTLKKSEVPNYGLNDYASINAKGHHIGEITVLRNDGVRYVFGVPAYNKSQKEMTFAVNGTGSCATGLVSYTGTEASTSNASGQDNFYSMSTTPAYAHSYMLSAIISQDYVDIDGIRGPSEGDLGNYTYFDYDANTNATAPGIQPTIANYKWRTPYSNAYYSEGLKSKTDDQKASVVYGQKEIFYVQKIKTKTHVAVFYSSPRKDATETAGETGGLGTQSMYKLDSIALFSAPDYNNLGNNAEAIKKVHFRYDYSLCPGVDNNDGALIDENGGTTGTDINSAGGKLTLKKIFFTYGKSRKGKLHAYEFTYADIDHNGSQDMNYAYNIKSYDRWGNYKPMPASPGCGIANDLTPAEYPYVDQDASGTDINKRAAAWSLTSIKIPSGGSINIDYESDDYAYVQNKEAMQMFKVVGCSDSNADASPGEELFEDGNNNYNNYIYVDINNTVDGNLVNDADFGERYLKDIRGGLLYFRFLTALGATKTDGQCDYVSGYASVGNVAGTDFGKYSNSRGWIKLTEIVEDDNSSDFTNPISKAAWNFGRIHNPKLAYSDFSGVNPTGGILDVLNALANASIINQIINLFQGPGTDQRLKNHGRYFEADKSWIRLYDSNHKKYGGGCRVSKITMYDNWKNMTGGGSSDYETARYGQEYFYDSAGNGSGTSNGVATYEPQPGGDENVFRRPVFSTEEHLLAPDEVSYLEEPFGEMFFPSPSVGYSKVKVRNLAKTDVTVNATGYSVSEFYTAKDFPTYTERTGILPIEKKSGLLGTLLKLDVKNYMTATQGYLVELNDMHGKPKAQWVYQEGKAEYISGVEYKYATETISHTLTLPGPGAITYTREALDNEVIAINPDNTVDYTDVGMEYDFTVDFRESISDVKGFSTKGNLAVFLAALFPIPVPTVFPGYSHERTVFRSAVNTKVINRCGILRETIAYDLGSKVSTENLAYDAQTGEVLLTKTINNYDDPIYNFTYPAHWAYEGMGQAYKNIGMTVTETLSGGNAAFTQSAGNIFLVPGDEVYIYASSVSSMVHTRAWVWDTDNDHTTAYLIDKDGQPLPNASGVGIKVIRSGRRNLQTLPIGALTLMDNPLEDTDVVPPDGLFDAINLTSTVPRPVRILQASSTEFSQNWGTFCDKEATMSLGTCQCTPDPVAFQFLLDFMDYMTTHQYFDVVGNTTLPTSITDPFITDLGFGGDPVYQNAGPSGSTMSGNFLFGPSAENFCHLIFRLMPGNSFPGGVGWGDMDGASYVGITPATMCNPPTEYIFLASFAGTPLYIGVKGNVQGNCFNAVCDEPDACAALFEQEVNPYRHNIRGSYRPQKQWLPLTGRTQVNYASSSNNYINLRDDGYFTSFTDFWDAPVSEFWTPNTTNWTWSSEITKYDPYGNEIENKDALERYSGAVYGYNNKLAIAVGSNTSYNEIAFDGFEDYDFKVISECCKEHFDFYDYYDDNKIVDDESHSGRYSLQISNSSNVQTTYDLMDASPGNTSNDMPYTVKQADLLGYFAPQTYLGNRRMVLSYWIKVDNPAYDEIHSYTGITPEITHNSGGTVITPQSTVAGNIIDGWQQVTIVFVVPSTAVDNIRFKFTNSSGETAWIDDIRVNPFNSSMKSFVYDPVTLRLWAELDERNFATFYEYDEEGALIRVKKETEKGIMTIQESRNNTQKVNDDN